MTITMNLTDAVAEQIVAELEAMAKTRTDREARAQELESQGYRIIDGGQISSTRWEITDWRTGAVLAKGLCSDIDNDPENIELPGKCYHIDRIREDTFYEAKRVEGLPESLADAIVEWTCEHEEDARAFAAVIAGRNAP